MELVGCHKAPTSSTTDSSSRAAPEREPWIGNDPKSWPQLVLTNEATFDGHTPLDGASSFLIRNRAGTVFGATARHLIREAGGVEPPMTAAMLKTDLIGWKAYPRTAPNEAIQFGVPAVGGLDAPSRDWLILSADASASLPSVALRLRATPIQPGEPVYLVGCSYQEKNCRQAVYKGTNVRLLPNGFSRFTIDPPVELPGFSGAPIIDGDGLVVGVMTISFDARKEGDKYREAGGQVVGQLYDVVERAK